jgi:hypothetical protein
MKLNMDRRELISGAAKLTAASVIGLSKANAQEILSHEDNLLTKKPGYEEMYKKVKEIEKELFEYGAMNQKD